MDIMWRNVIEMQKIFILLIRTDEMDVLWIAIAVSPVVRKSAEIEVVQQLSHLLLTEAESHVGVFFEDNVRKSDISGPLTTSDPMIIWIQLNSCDHFHLETSISQLHRNIFER